MSLRAGFLLHKFWIQATQTFTFTLRKSAMPCPWLLLGFFRSLQKGSTIFDCILHPLRISTLEMTFEITRPKKTRVGVLSFFYPVFFFPWFDSMSSACSKDEGMCGRTAAKQLSLTGGFFCNQEHMANSPNMSRSPLAYKWRWSLMHWHQVPGVSNTVSGKEEFLPVQLFPLDTFSKGWDKDG